MSPLALMLPEAVIWPAGPFIVTVLVPKVAVPLALMFPYTVSFYGGVDVPIPTLPEESIVKWLAI